MTDTPKGPEETSGSDQQQPATQGPVADATQSDAGENTVPRADIDAARQQQPDASAAAPAADREAAQQTPPQQAPGQAAAEQQTPVQQSPDPSTAAQPTGEQPTADYGTGSFGTPHNQTQPTEPLPPYTGQGAQNPYAAQQGAQNPYAAQGYGQQAYPQQQGHYQYAAQPGTYGQGGYNAQQAQYAQQPGSQHPTATQPAQPTQAPKPEKQKDGKGNRAGLIITGFVLAGLLGGGVGAGVVGVYAANSGSTKSVTSTGATSVTVNDPQTATNVTAVASKASPSVVTINVTGGQEAGTGSGVILSADGYVLTNTHVVTLDGETGTPTITVNTNDGKIYKAKVVGTDPVLDLAVIKLQDVSGLTPATFADSDKVNVGDSTVAIGAPLGLSGTVTNGIVSALNRSIQIASSAAPKQDQQDNGDNGDDSPFNFWNDQNDGGSKSSAESTISLPVIQTDAAINPGNSGGALLNGKAQVMGINVAIASAGSSSDSSGQSGSIGVGFAIPSNVAQRVADEIIKNGKATSGLLGATVADSGSSSDATTVGALIKSVTSGGAAASAGLKAGDIVTNFNGKPITDATDLTAQVRALAGGSKADVTYQRDGKAQSATVTLGTLADS